MIYRVEFVLQQAHRQHGSLTHSSLVGQLGGQRSRSAGLFSRLGRDRSRSLFDLYLLMQREEPVYNTLLGNPHNGSHAVRELAIPFVLV